MNFYFLSTGLHGLHVIGGVLLLGIAALRRSAREDRDAVLVGNVALYWHLVDVIWLFLYPTLYLPGVS
jgi:cytochrome c oxidase subunit 3